MALIAGTLIHSVIATRRDGFTIDESYHITAGVSYIKTGDFRINPEHPPLVKVWTGAFLAASGFRLPPLRQFRDKPDERAFTADTVFLQNDYPSVQRRSRIAMWILNSILLVGLALALRFAFGDAVALAAMLFLAIDPTVSAHLPLVMTDLPVALLGASAVVLATRAFRTWAWVDLAFTSFALGLALAAKHSAPIFFLFIAALGGVLAIGKSSSGQGRIPRIARVVAVLLAAWMILWSLYLFRFRESTSPQEVFNRPLAHKMSDVGSPGYRAVLTTLATTHALPRAYIWGFADTIHAGLEGRAYQQVAFGRVYYNKAPWFFFPGIIAVKLPIGLELLAIYGILVALHPRCLGTSRLSALIVLAALCCFLFVLRSGATYAGIRHALPAVILLAILAGLAAAASFHTPRLFPKVLTSVAFAVAAASALPTSRAWEYFNETIPKQSAYLYFSDESIDMGQRSNELGQYVNAVVKPTGEIPFITYLVAPAQRRAMGLDWIGRDLQRDQPRLAARTFSGTILIAAQLVSQRMWWDLPSLRSAEPVTRFGNLLVYRGTFDVRGRIARDLYRAALIKIFAQQPDLQMAEQLLQQSIDADPTAFFVYIELGNLYLEQGSRQKAEQAYGRALQYAPARSDVRVPLKNQIQLLSTSSLSQIGPLRDPGLE